jgi:hypothetical protein
VKTFLFGPKGPPRFFAHEKEVAKSAQIYTKLFFFWFLYILISSFQSGDYIFKNFLRKHQYMTRPSVTYGWFNIYSTHARIFKQWNYLQYNESLGHWVNHIASLHLADCEDSILGGIVSHPHTQNIQRIIETNKKMKWCAHYLQKRY